MNKILIIDDDHGYRDVVSIAARKKNWEAYTSPCLLYTSDAADE